MSLLDFYNSVEKISYKDYQLDHFRNILILNVFEKVAKTLNDNCIPFVTTGSLGSIFYSKKCYRTLQDIDIDIEEKDLLKTLHLLKYSFNIHIPLEKNAKEVLTDFQMEGSPIFLESIGTKVKLDLHMYGRGYKSICLNKVFILNSDNILYHYRVPSKIIDTSYNRQKDIDDIEIYMLKKHLS